MIKDTSEKVDIIQKCLLMVQSRNKSYANKRQKLLEFEIGDHVFLKVMPNNRVVRFGKRGKMSPRYFRPFEVLKKVDTIAYQFAFLPNLSSVHTVFHVSIL